MSVKRNTDNYLLSGQFMIYDLGYKQNQSIPYNTIAIILVFLLYCIYLFLSFGKNHYADLQSERI